MYEGTQSLPRVWRTWVVANIAGELIGFGLAAAAGAMVALALQQTEGGFALALGAFGVIVLGTLEGGVLGFAQWLALRRWLPALRPSAWVTATILGAIFAWAVGMVVSFLGIGLVQPDTPLAVIALIGAATGLAIGATVASVTGLALVWLLSRPQELRRLRHHELRAGELAQRAP